MQKFQGVAGRPVLCPVDGASTPCPGCPLRAAAGLGGSGTARSLEAWDILGPRCACCWLQFHSSDDHGLPILNHFKFEPSNFLSQPPLGVLWLSFFCLALNTSLIVLLEILGTGSIKSNMPRYSAQIRHYRDRQKQMPVFRRTFPASDNPLNINNRIQKAATARYTSGYGVGSFPARVRPEKVEETLLSFSSVHTGVEWC